MSYQHDRYNSHHGGGGGGGKGRYYRNDRPNREHSAPERPEAKIRNALVKFADDPDSEPTDEIPRLARYLREHLISSPAAIAEGLRIGVTELPFKIPFYAYLLCYLDADSAQEPTGDSRSQLTSVLEDFVKGFQGYLDSLKWRELRLCIQFFGHLVSMQVVAPASLLAVLKSFTAVLDEPGVSYSRARQAGLCAGEGLLRAGVVLHTHDATSVNDIITALKAFADGSSQAKSLVAPLVRSYDRLGDVSEELPDCKETIGCLVKSLTHMQDSSFQRRPAALPEPLPPVMTPGIEPLLFELSAVLVPPDALDLEGEEIGAPAPVLEDGQPKPPLKQDVPYVYLSIFPSDMTPLEMTPSAYLVRTCMVDMLNIYEVNRKEGARLLLDLPRWWAYRTFKGRDDIQGEEGKETMQWVLECTAVETVLSTAFLLPTSPHSSVYYYALIAELCKLSPTTVGPAVGKSIRRLYKCLGDETDAESAILDVEVARRFTEWFAVHMSNFGFNWVWKEWIPDLSLSAHHPRRKFINRAIELEIRASYYDRIKETLPADFHAPESHAVPFEAPGPNYEYEDPQHPNFTDAEALLDLIRKRSKIDEVVNLAQTMVQHLTSESSSTEAHTVVRSIAVQVILHVGSRSFSHFLNAIERYLALLRLFSKETQAKAEVLDTAARFWKRSSLMVGIVFDKLMQYQIVDPSDVVAWTFRAGNITEEIAEGALTVQGWEMLKAALDKASGRVAVAKYKVHIVKKEEEDAKARLKASKGAVVDDGMDVDVSIQDDMADALDSAALTAALKAHATLTRDQKTALVRALDGFVSYLGSSPTAGTVLSQDSWQSRERWGMDEWSSWQIWGWYRQFCRAHTSQLRTYMNTLESVSLSKLDSTVGVDATASAMVKSIWELSLSGE
ncbi:hypothetical protein FRB95_000806 [Tulasnella sp. JGI-2019a]|nr:hypothetical protein FRB93_007500 [Tulasnella sp. JGI-2019a]KAG9038584.1 hypothetical protein FRB95_000806 [Tulasnella sp. JGI-2019a]